MTTGHPYVEERNGTYYVRGQRVPVSALAYDWNNGIDVDAIARSFSILKVSEVLGALAFYLDHR